MRFLTDVLTVIFFLVSLLTLLSTLGNLFFAQ